MSNFWAGKKVVVTGSKGFMGQWLVDKLSAFECRIDLVDIFWGMEIRDYDLMQKGLGETDVIFHLAAISGVEHSRDLGFEAIDINVRGTYTVLEAALKQPKPPIVLVATSNHVYGHQDKYPVPESAGMFQMDTYSASKVCADVLTRAYWHNYGLPTAAVRNTNCFGPSSPHKDHLIEGTILSILRGEKPVIKGKGLTKKSYMHVEDTIDAYLKIAELVDKHPGEAWNVAGLPYSVKEVVETICEVMGWEGGIEILGKHDDQADENMDTSKIRGLGWKPKWSLRATIEDTVEYYRSNTS